MTDISEFKFLVNVLHRDGKIRDIIIHGGERVSQQLNILHQYQPKAYGRLIHYKQCRYLSRNTANVRVYWFLLTSLDWEAIQIYVNKELEAHNGTSRPRNH